MYNILKRLVDIIVALAVGLVFLPLILLIAIAIKFDSPGPIIYRQKRVGKDGKIFDLLKFRSMIAEADNFLKANSQFRKSFKKPEGWKAEASEDPRITRVGRFTRKYSIDELPQIWNILIGDMSIVGPRAYRKDNLGGDEIEEQLKFHPHLRDKVKIALSVRPGLSGPWQVGGRNKIPWDKRVELDADYAQRHSIFNDIKIIFKTPFAMLNKW